jgi:hypothetical protein
MTLAKNLSFALWTFNLTQHGTTHSREGTMRMLIGVTLLLAASALVDEMMLKGRYRESLWHGAQSQGRQINQTLQGWLNKATL